LGGLVRRHRGTGDWVTPRWSPNGVDRLYAVGDQRDPVGEAWRPLGIPRVGQDGGGAPLAEVGVGPLRRPPCGRASNGAGCAATDEDRCVA